MATQGRGCARPPLYQYAAAPSRHTWFGANGLLLTRLLLPLLRAATPARVIGSSGSALGSYPVIAYLLRDGGCEDHSVGRQFEYQAAG
jgi:hypothetical protein